MIWRVRFWWTARRRRGLADALVASKKGSGHLRLLRELSDTTD